MPPIIQKVIQQEAPKVKVPGGQGIGLIPGSTCEICPKGSAKLSVSICNYSMKYFAGCNRSFCNMHGIGHFAIDMIDSKYFNENRLKELEMSDYDIEFFK